MSPELGDQPRPVDLGVPTPMALIVRARAEACLGELRLHVGTMPGGELKVEVEVGSLARVGNLLEGPACDRLDRQAKRSQERVGGGPYQPEEREEQVERERLGGVQVM